MLLFISQYDKWARKVNGTIDHTWTGFGMQVVESDNVRFMNAIEALEEFKENASWRKRVADLLVTALLNTPRPPT